MDTPFRVGISGSYGGLNLGDEAILEGILSQLRGSLAVEVTVFSRNPEDTLKRHAVEHAVPVRDMSREEVRAEIARLDLFILGGGGILFDAEASIYLREVMLAHEHGVPVLVYAISAGPLDRPESGAAVKEALDRAAIITVRERGSKHLLESLGVHQEIHVTADPALLLEPQPGPADALEREGIEREGKWLIGLSVREPGVAAPDLDADHYHGLLANVGDYLTERFDADLIFVPMESRMQDLQHSHAVVSKMANPRRAHVLKGTYTSGAMLALITHFDFAVGMRLHFLIFSALNHVPFVALPYGGKVDGFLEDLQMPMPRIQGINAGQLIAHLDRSLDTRQELKQRIADHLPGLIERARLTNRFAVELLTASGRRTTE
ncbi:MAG TPA: polysaccharide pyruvyl transferase family protein [Vicinamibacterales bacterium]|nr:polysaccharide pyruvyl transferase family protein [Vicinamibacterales bacterium]